MDSSAYSAAEGPVNQPLAGLAEKQAPPLPVPAPVAVTPVAVTPVAAAPVAIGRLASPGQRLGGMLLSGLLVVVTLGIGYVVWALVAWAHASTPAKQVMSMQVVDARSGLPATFGQMFMRQVVFTIVLGAGSVATLGILGLVDAFTVSGDSRQRLLDKMAGTLVVRS